jgi:RNA polymerase sigma-70 factor (ECF subfamily)
MNGQIEIESVLDRIERGDRDAFQQIVRAFGLPLRSYVAARVYHLDELDDLTQEVFIAAYRSLPTFHRGDDFGAWLRGIARNKVQLHSRSSIRRNKALERFRDEVAQAIQADLDRAASSDQSEAIEMLLQCIGRLPERMRRVVRAGLEGNKPAALAEELAVSVTAIYNLHCRANRLLRECLHKELS